MKKRILVISSANVDLVLRTDTFPRAGETVVSAACQDAQRNRAAIPTGINIFFFIFSLV